MVHMSFDQQRGEMLYSQIPPLSEQSQAFSLLICVPYSLPTYLPTYLPT
jgi:hypothetical protein